MLPDGTRDHLPEPRHARGLVDTSVLLDLTRIDPASENLEDFAELGSLLEIVAVEVS